MSATKSAKLLASAPAADIPSVDRLLHARALSPLLEQYGRMHVTAELRAHLEELRRAALAHALRADRDGVRRSPG